MKRFFSRFNRSVPPPVPSAPPSPLATSTNSFRSTNDSPSSTEQRVLGPSRTRPNFDYRKYPDDVWREVFKALCLISDSTREMDVRFFRISEVEKNVLAASEVCSLFRRLIHETPACWRVISYCGPHAKHGSGASLIRFMNSLERSKQQPIDVLLCINNTEALPTDVYSLMLMYSADFNDLSLTRLFNFLLPHLRRVEKLALVGDSNSAYRYRTLWVEEEHPMNQMRTEPWTGLPLSALRSIYFNWALIVHSRHLQLLLRHCSRLTVIETTNSALGSAILDHEPHQPLKLPFLTTMITEMDFLCILVEIGLITPTLQHMDLVYYCAGLDPSERTLPDFSFAASVVSLKVEGLGIYDEDLRILFPKLPQLSVLELSRWRGGRRLVDILCTPAARGAMLVPNLEHLIVHFSKLTDSDIRKLLQTRTRSRSSAVKTLIIDLVDSMKTTEFLGYELARSGRGSKQKGKRDDILDIMPLLDFD